jgi:hypothetical protein
MQIHHQHTAAKGIRRVQLLRQWQRQMFVMILLFVGGTMVMVVVFVVVEVVVVDVATNE